VHGTNTIMCIINYITLYYGQQHQPLETTGKYVTLVVDFEAKVILEIF